jgi:DNA polymerase/3'-5' exonuclease PolX
MNSQSIATYIANLEKENAELRERLQKCEEEKAILEYETMLHYAEVSDDESIASDTDSESEDEDFFVSYNRDLADAFQTLADDEENEFKKDAYERASDIIYHMDYKITNGHQISHVYGIGKSIVRKINEFLETGSFKTFTTNENIAEQLELLSHTEENTHKSEAYKKAADAIRKLKFEVTNGTEISTGPLKVPGIGKGIARKIDEYVVNGEIKKNSRRRHL